MDQLDEIIGYVTRKGILVERFPCFLPNVGHKTEGLFNAVTAALIKKPIDIKIYRRQWYCLQHVWGAQARIREITPMEIYSPCGANSLILVCEHSASSCKESCKFFMLLNNIYNFFSSFTKRWEVIMRRLNNKRKPNLKSIAQNMLVCMLMMSFN